MDAEVEQIKRDRFEALRRREVVILVKHDYGYQVEQWFPDGVAPTSDYDTPHETAARALQLLGLKEPIKPQDWAEIAQIGNDPNAKPPRTPYPAKIGADAHLIAAAPDMLAALLRVACPGGGWNGMPKDMENPTVADCLRHNACGCIFGDAVKKAKP